MAAVVHVGGGRRVRVVQGREPEDGRSTGESESGPGGCVASSKISGRPGRQGGAGAARLRAGHAAASGRGEEDDGGAAWLPPRHPGRLPRHHATPPDALSLSLDLSPSSVLPTESRRRRRSQPPRPQPLPRSLSAYPSSARTPSPSTSTHRSPDAPRRCRGASSPTTAAGCRRPIHPLRRLPEHADLLFELTVSSYASPLSFPPRLRPVASIPPEPELACRRPCRRRSHR